MLVLTRKLNQRILIGDGITVTILRIKGNTIRLGVEAPRDVRVLRGELPALAQQSSSSKSADPTTSTGLVSWRQKRQEALHSP